jgi:phosphatidylserine/phosphatidylglycerophosphate/cardiolipin synthase-like enzyme
MTAFAGRPSGFLRAHRACGRSCSASTRAPAKGGATEWNLSGLGHIDHRKLMVVDGRVERVGGAGIEDHFQEGRFHDLFLRVEGPVVAQLQFVFLASFRWLRGEIDSAELDSLFPFLEGGADPVPARVLHNAPGRYRPITDAIARLWRTRPQRSTSSTRTSPTAG